MSSLQVHLETAGIITATAVSRSCGLSFQMDLNGPFYILLCCFTPRAWNQCHRENPPPTYLPHCLDNTQHHLLSLLNCVSVALSLCLSLFFLTFFDVLLCFSVTPFMSALSLTFAFSPFLLPLLALYCCFSGHITPLCYVQAPSMDLRPSSWGVTHRLCQLSGFYRSGLSFSEIWSNVHACAYITRMRPLKSEELHYISCVAIFPSFCIPFSPLTLIWQITTVAKECLIQKLWPNSATRILARLPPLSVFKTEWQGKPTVRWLGRSFMLERLLLFSLSSPFFGETSKYLWEKQQQQPLIICPLQQDSGTHPNPLERAAFCVTVFAESSMKRSKEPV